MWVEHILKLGIHIAGITFERRAKNLFSEPIYKTLFVLLCFNFAIAVHHSNREAISKQGILIHNNHNTNGCKKNITLFIVVF